MQPEVVSRDQEIRQRLKWLMILRVAVITVLLGSLAVLQLYQQREPLPAVYLLIIATYVLTIAYSLALPRVGNPDLFATVQITGDVLFVTGMIYATGGLDSPFSFLYIFAVLAAGFLLRRRVSLIMAALSGIFYGSLIDLQFYGIILSAPGREYAASEIFYYIFLFFFALFSVAFLSSSLSERLRATRAALEEKSIGLQELQALNDSIVRSMADGMVISSLEGRVIAFNKAAEEITGLGFRDVRGRYFSEVFNWVGVEDVFEGRPEERSPRYFELDFKRPDKDLVLGMGISPLKNEHGDITGILGIFQDLTPIKEMEARVKRKERLAAIGELAAGMAHEIRNPLASLSGSLQVLKENTSLTGEEGHLMNIALEETDRLNGIVTEFLTYARPKEPAKQGCDLGTIVKDTVRLVKNSREFREDIKLVTQLPDYPLLLEADPGQLRQVLLNLTLNAVQAIPGEGCVEIRARYGTDSVVIEVLDEGEGIAREDMDKIFYPFYSTKGGGAGLGLAIVYRIVEEHGGLVKVESEPGAGSRFTVELPARVGSQ